MCLLKVVSEAPLFNIVVNIFIVPSQMKKTLLINMQEISIALVVLDFQFFNSVPSLIIACFASQRGFSCWSAGVVIVCALSVILLK